jgi:hypothetical protein
MSPFSVGVAEGTAVCWAKIAARYGMGDTTRADMIH